MAGGIIASNIMINAQTCQNCKNRFLPSSEDESFYKKIKVPAPTFCPECREQRRIAFRNERALYKRKCDLCGNIVVSRVSPDKPYPMYCKDCWWSDKWDSLAYGRDYDFSKPFFEQFHELMFSTPHVSLFSANTVNSDWVNQETDVKNCYLNVGGHYNEDCAYNTYAIRCKDVFDNYWQLQSELCYENVNCERCSRVLFSQDCFDSQEIILSYDCRNCMYCFGCAGLRNKQYCVFNEQLSKEAYYAFLTEYSVSSFKKLKALQNKAHGAWLNFPHRNSSIIQSHNSNGNYVNQCKNARHCFNAAGVEDSAYGYIAASFKDSFDQSSVGWGELMYEGCSSVGLYNSRFFVFCAGGGTAETVHSYDLEYCYAVNSSRDCFGCANLRGRQYCILNKQYEESDYRALKSKITEHMNNMPYLGKNERLYKYGEFFPIEISPFGYNETVANDHFPLSKEQALGLGYNWSDYELEVQYSFSDYVIPDDVKDVKDDILDQVLKCEVSGRAYRIIPMELQFYRRLGLPIPRRAPLQRHKDRFGRLSPWKLYPRKCECLKHGSKKSYENTAVHAHGPSPCLNEFNTPYSPDSPELVYCDACYQSEVI